MAAATTANGVNGGGGTDSASLAAVLGSTLQSARDKLVRATPSGQEPRSARELYSAVSQNDLGSDRPLVGEFSPHHHHHHRACVDGQHCGLLVAFVILANTTVIGFECQDIANADRKAFYQQLELAFVCIYLIELCLRSWQHGCSAFLFPRDTSDRGWNWFDLVTTIVGTAGVICDEVAHVHLNASVLRLLRVLRIMRVFRILKFMKDIEYTLISAMTSMIRIMFLVLMIDYIGAVVITHLLHDSEDEVVLEMFGHLSNSMYHLFVVMVDGMGAVHISSTSEAPGGLIVITEKVMEVYPHMWFFWVAFVFVGTISLMALVPAIFVELNLRDAEQARKRQQKEDWERRVETQRHALEVVFNAADSDGSHSISREEMETFLQSKDVLKRVGLEVDEEDEDGNPMDDQLDIRQLRMEFSMVYDTIEAEGRLELTCNEFIDAFRQMRAKPMDQVVLTLQQEIFKLRTLMIGENKKLQDEMHLLARGKPSSRRPSASDSTGASTAVPNAERPPPPLPAHPQVVANSLVAARPTSFRQGKA